MAKTKKPDYILLGTVGALIVLGLIILASASVVMGKERFGESYYYLRHQLIYGLFGGLVLGFVVYRIDYKVWKKLSLPLFLLGFLLLLLVFIPNFGYSYGGAVRWIKLGDFSLQPSEIIKLGFILYLAAWLERKETSIKDFSEGFFPFVFVVGLVGIALIFQPDISTLGIITLSALTIFFLAGAKIFHLSLLILGGLGLLWGLVKIAPYRMARFITFFNPQVDPQGISYQINQALLAVGSGGILGRGLGLSFQKHNFLPEPIGDSIFAIWAEEMGLVGGVIIVLLFLIFVWRGFTISKKCPDKFGELLAAGITSWIGLQAFINIASIIGLIPLTGLPLPFISYGGSALIVSMAGVAMLLNISKHEIR